MSFDDYINSIDWEREYYKDYLYTLEKEMELEASYRAWEEEQKKRKPAKIILNGVRSSSFRRTTKKILLLRSRLSSKTDRAKV